MIFDQLGLVDTNSIFLGSEGFVGFVAIDGMGCGVYCMRKGCGIL
jgi:hypothetical protein